MLATESFTYSYPDLYRYYREECVEAAQKLIKAHKDLKKWYENILRNHSQLKSNTDYAFTGILYQLLEFEPFRGYVGIDIGSGVTDERAARNISILSAVLGKYEYLHRIEVFSEKNIISAPEIFFNMYMRFLFEGGITEYEDDSEYAPSGCISFMTIHQSKGMEFPVVMVDSLSAVPRTQSDGVIEEIEKKYFHRPAFEAKEDIKFFDFWRLYYTAFSRAQNLLVLSCYEKNGIGRTPSKYFESCYSTLPSYNDVDLSKMELEMVKPVNIKKSFSFTSHIELYENCSLQYKFFKELGFTQIRVGGMVSIWMSDIKRNIDDLTGNDGSPAFLLMKQAISTGWDCPRAKILVKLREGGSEDFQIQTIGRIRRMPEKKHYGLNTLDYCYIYTLDSHYKMGLLSSMDKAYQVRRLFVRDKAKDFVLTKELRNLDFDGLGERETLEKVYEYFKKKYSLGSDMRINRENLEACGYNFDHEIDSKILQGIFRTTEELASGVGKNNVTIKTAVNTHSHGIYLLHSVDEIKKVTGLQSQKVKNILRRMFSKGKKTKYKFVALENSDFYAFIINNVKQLKIDFKGCTAQMGGRQMSFVLEPKQAEFSIPEMEIYKYSEVKKRQLMRLNAYLEYTNEFITDKTRSMPERLFERYCETRPDRIEWVYKNGDTGQQYLSIVYLDGFLKQWLFYPDYIVKTNDSQVWLIETKGGEVAGHSKNIDIQVENKFIAFKQYAEKYKLNFGFVRDINEDLFINNTEYHEDMSHDSWRPLSDLL